MKRLISIRENVMVRRRWCGLAIAGIAFVASGCGQSPSTLDPAGPAARRIEDVWWFLFALGLVVFVVVTGLILYALVRSRAMVPARRVLGMNGQTFTVVAGAIIPLVILTVVAIQTFRTMAYFSEPPSEPTLTVDVIGWMWWWEIRYETLGIVTANEIRIPAGEVVQFRTTSADVIHAVWPSELAGKIDATPGEENILWLQADEPGVYRGQCAEYCGLQHANMDFLVIAMPRDEFDAWVLARSEPPLPPSTASAQRGKEVFFDAQCYRCHAIAGTEADGRSGPDLTHLASRETLGAALIPNNRATRGGWIVAPQDYKPGNKMPPFNLEPDDLEALLDYLETLE